MRLVFYNQETAEAFLSDQDALTAVISWRKPHDTTIRVLFDVNVWLDLANILGADADKSRITAALEEAQKDSRQSPRRRLGDSLILWEKLGCGRFAGEYAVEVYSAPHITRLLTRKLTCDPAQSGFGWSDQDAKRFVAHFVEPLAPSRLIDPTGTLEPELFGQEDGRIASFAQQGDIDYVVTRDRQLIARSAQANPNVIGRTQYLYPTEFIKQIDQARKDSAAPEGGYPGTSERFGETDHYELWPGEVHSARFQPRRLLPSAAQRVFYNAVAAYKNAAAASPDDLLQRTETLMQLTFAMDAAAAAIAAGHQPPPGMPPRLVAELAASIPQYDPPTNKRDSSPGR